MIIAPHSGYGTGFHAAQSPAGSAKLEDVEKVSQQFEAILLRQFLSESMRSLLDSGPSAQVYGYLLTDSIAGSMSAAGGLGLCSVLQAQLGAEPSHVKP
jgi:Rod binding domain-containing protein